MNDAIRLKDACKILNGFAFKSSKYVDSGIRIIRIANVQKGYVEDEKPAFYPDSEEPLVRDYLLEENDLLLSLTGNVGRVALLDKKWLPAALNQRVACLRIKDNRIIKDYLYFALLSNKFENDCIKSSKGIAQKNMSTEWLKDYEIPLPSEQRQREIVSSLKQLSTIIKNKTEQIRQLDNLIKARFVEMFGMPGTDPFSYGIKELGKCCELNPKKTQDKRLTSNIDVSFIPMPSVSENGDIDPTDIRSYEEVKKGFTYFAENDVLFAKITPCMENGKGAVARGLKNGIGFGSTEFHVLRPTKDISNPYWIYVLTSFKSFRKDAETNMTGSAGQRRTPVSFLDNYKVALPPIYLQNRFAAFVAQVDKSKFAVQKSLEKTQLLFDSLMQEYYG